MNAEKTDKKNRKCANPFPPPSEAVSQLEKSRHSREGEGGNLGKKIEFLNHSSFSITDSVWMPAFAGMTNYDTVSPRGRARVGRFSFEMKT